MHVALHKKLLHVPVLLYNNNNGRRNDYSLDYLLSDGEIEKEAKIEALYSYTVQK